VNQAAKTQSAARLTISSASGTNRSAQLRSLTAKCAAIHRLRLIESSEMQSNPCIDASLQFGLWAAVLTLTGVGRRLRPSLPDHRKKHTWHLQIRRHDTHQATE